MPIVKLVAVPIAIRIVIAVTITTVTSIAVAIIVPKLKPKQLVIIKELITIRFPIIKLIEPTRLGQEFII